MPSTARQLDIDDPLKKMRDHFFLPKSKGCEDIYFVGNSLGLMPRQVESFLQTELDKWRSIGVGGHFEGEFPWVSYHEPLAVPMANLVGAMADEVVIMNTLTVNLHLMLATFYRPSKSRCQILIEDHAFPSDQYAVDSHVRWHGLDPAETVIRLAPDQKQLFSCERICETIEAQAGSLALVLLPGVQYYTGQVFDLAEITKTAHRFDIPVGFDLAHAAGNLPLSLHEWDVDFAVWCTYKYLNSGPGSIAGCFIHQRHATDTSMNRLAGWWGHDKASRFLMQDGFKPIPTAEGWQLSNPPILSLAAIRASLDEFELAGGMEPLRKKSVAMHQFFRDCLDNALGDRVKVIAPASQSGCQLSLEIVQSQTSGQEIHRQLESAGIRTDWREPNVIRAAPVPLYNTFDEIERFVQKLKDIITAS